MSMQLTPEFVDGILANMDSSLERVLESQGRLVQLPGAELDLLRQVELVRDFMVAVVRQSDRVILQNIFGGDCSRVSHVRALLESATFSEMNAGDQRLRTCLEACESVEKVLADIGFLRALNEAQEKERASLVDRLQHSCDDATGRPSAAGDSDLAHENGPQPADNASEAVPVSHAVDMAADEMSSDPANPASEHAALDACETSALQASVVENAAIELDRQGQTQDALQKYEECEKLLAAAIAAARNEHEEDHPKLIQHREEVLMRMTYLRSLAEGEVPTLPVEDHIHAVQLSMCVAPVEPTAADTTSTANGQTPPADSSRRSVAKYVALGVMGAAALSSGGFIVLGGAYMAAGASAAAGVAGAGFCAVNPKTVDTAAHQAGSAASETAEKAKQIGKQAAGSFVRQKSFVEGFSSKLTDAGAAAAAKAAQVSGNGSESAKQFGSKLISGLTGASLLISNAASEGSQRAKELSKGITTKLADTGASVSETAAKVTASGAESASKIGDAIFDRLALSSQATKTCTEEGEASGTAVTESTRGSRSSSGSWLPSTLNLGISSSFSKAMGSSSVQVDDGAADRDHTSAADSTHELRVEVLTASDLGGAEYRVGDMANTLLNAAVSANMGAAYVELQLGGRRVSTAPAPISAAASGRSVAFVGERHLFAYSSEQQFSVCVREQRKLQSVMRGDPLVGDGSVPLGAEILDCQPRSESVAILRNGAPAGTVTLRYQLLPVPGQELQVHNFEPQERRCQIPAQAESEQEGDVDFRTPPGSPR